jgi:hypothetical protein
MEKKWHLPSFPQEHGKPRGSYKVTKSIKGQETSPPPLSVSKLSTDRLTSVLVEGARTQEEQEADHDDLLQIVQ